MCLFLSLELQHCLAVRIVLTHTATVQLPAQEALRVIGTPEFLCVWVGLRTVAVHAVHVLTLLDLSKKFSLLCEPLSDGLLRSNLAHGQLLLCRWRLCRWLRGPQLPICMCRLQAFAWLTGAHM